MNANAPAAVSVPMSVVVVDDHLLLAESVAQMLRDRNYRARVAYDHSVTGLLDEIERAQASVVLLDLDLARGIDGTDLIPALAAEGLSVVVVTGSSDPDAPGRCLEAGAAGLIRKELGVAAILEALGRLAVDEPVVSDAQRARQLHEYQASSRDAGPARLGSLTQSEVATLRGLMQGQSAAAIAATRFVSVATVRSQIRGVLTKLGVGSQLEAVALAYRSGWKP